MPERFRRDRRGIGFHGPLGGGSHARVPPERLKRPLHRIGGRHARGSTAEENRFELRGQAMGRELGFFSQR